MELTISTKIGELIDKYPYLVEFLPTVSPKYKKLTNPIVRKTMGNIATLNMVAKMGDIDFTTLKRKIEDEIRRNEGVKSASGTVVSGERREARPGIAEDRAEVLKSIIKDLHAGVPMDVLKQRFAELVKDISPSEISRMEQKLIDEGMPESEVKRLCDVHVQVFRHSLDAKEPPKAPLGHPVHTFMEENRISEKIIEEIQTRLHKIGTPPNMNDFFYHKMRLINLMERLGELDKHYLRKENQLFPILEKHGISGPSSVMWAIHDDIRAEIKAAKAHLAEDKAAESIASMQNLAKMVREMVYKEEHILLPMSMETLSSEDWSKVRQGEEELGYAWVMPAADWPDAGVAHKSAGVPAETTAAAPTAVTPAENSETVPEPAAADDPEPAGDKVVHADSEPGPEDPAEAQVCEAKIILDTGALSQSQVNLMLKHLPLDLTFVNANDEVAYYSAGKERIFPRSPGIIGRKVQKCHPPKSIDVVENILKAFKDGTKENADFWVEAGGRLIYIRYFAIRDPGGNYQGTLEISQDITDIKMLDGERRLLDWTEG